jgi:hypothetical protein
MAGAYRELAQRDKADQWMKKARVLNKGTAREINRGVTHAFFYKDQPRKTIQMLEAFRADENFLTSSLSRGREEKDLLRQLAWLYTREGDTEKAIGAYEQYFAWLVEQNASIDAFELQNWSKYQALAKKGKAGFSTDKRASMGKKLRELNRSLLDRGTFQTNLLIDAMKEEEIYAANFKAYIASR